MKIAIAGGHGQIALMLARLLAAVIGGIRRVVMISAMSADNYDPASDDVFQIYLRAKSEADDHLRARDLDWTIVRRADDRRTDRSDYRRSDGGQG